MRTWPTMIAVALVASAPAAHALVLCTMPDGRTYAGDAPPSACVVTKTFTEPDAQVKAENPPGPANEADDSFSVTSSNARRKLERDLNTKAEELVDVRGRVAAVSNAPIFGYGGDTASGAAVAMVANLQSDKSEKLTKLRAEERRVLAGMAEVWKQFDDLSAGVKEHFNGTLPVWWRNDLRCSDCPTRAEVEASLK